MRTVRQIAEEIVAREGGFVNDPDDPGGATNFGVTLGTLKRLDYDADGDGQTDINDVKALAREDAIEIFIRHYYRATGIAALPEMLQPSVFDMYVNAGKTAVTLLQRLLIDMGFAVSVDGEIGPLTARAAQKAAEQAQGYLADAYGISRRNYYYSLADRRASSRKYARRRDGGKGGWILRAEEFISPRFHLSDADHQARVATWA